MRGLTAQFPPASLQTPEVSNVSTRAVLDLFWLTITGVCDPGPEADDSPRACWTAEGGCKSYRLSRMWVLILRQRGKYGGRWRGECDEPHDHPNLNRRLDLNVPWGGGWDIQEILAIWDNLCCVIYHFCSLLGVSCVQFYCREVYLKSVVVLAENTHVHRYTSAHPQHIQCKYL